MITETENSNIITMEQALDSVKRGEALKVRFRATDDGSWLRGEIVAVLNRGRVKIRPPNSAMTHEVELQHVRRDKTNQSKADEARAAYEDRESPSVASDEQYVLLCRSKKLFYAKSRGFSRNLDQAQLYNSANAGRAAHHASNSVSYHAVCGDDRLEKITLIDAARLVMLWDSVRKLPEPEQLNLGVVEMDAATAAVAYATGNLPGPRPVASMEYIAPQAAFGSLKIAKNVEPAPAPAPTPTVVAPTPAPPPAPAPAKAPPAGEYDAALTIAAKAGAELAAARAMVGEAEAAYQTALAAVDEAKRARDAAWTTSRLKLAAAPPADFRGSLARWQAALIDRKLWDGTGYFGAVQVGVRDYMACLEEAERAT